MKTKVLSLLVTACLLIAAARLVHAPDEAQADSAPEKYRDTVRKALDFLVKNQHKDGHWEGTGGNHPVAITGLTGLALLMQKDRRRYGRELVGETESESIRLANIRKAADWLMAQSRAGRDGLLFSEHASEASRYMHGHGLATQFLAGAHEIEGDEARQKKLADVLARAVNYILKAQSTQGGWYDTSKVEGHDFATIQATVVQMQALEAVSVAGIPVPMEALSDGSEYLKATLAKRPADADATGERSRLADTAAALAGHREGGAGFGRLPEPDERKDYTIPKAFEYCRSKIPLGRDLQFGRDELVHLHYAMAEYVDRGHVGTKDVVVPDHWKENRTALFDQLQRTQNKDGSWPAGDGASGGPVYGTAIWCILLQLEGNRHPSARVYEQAVK
jgi:hypothetical protein